MQDKVRRNSQLLQRGYRMAKKSGKIADQMKYAQDGDAMGIPVGRVTNAAELQGTAEADYSNALQRSGQPMPPTGLDAYDNRHSSVSGIPLGQNSRLATGSLQTGSAQPTPTLQRPAVPQKAGSKGAIQLASAEDDAAITTYQASPAQTGGLRPEEGQARANGYDPNRPGDSLDRDGSGGYSSTMNYQRGIDDVGAVDTLLADRKYPQGLNPGPRAAPGANIGGYSFDQMGSSEGQQGFSPAAPFPQKSVDEFRARWKAANASGNKQAADDIVAEGAAAGAPMSPYGLKTLGRRRLEQRQGLRGTGEEGPAGAAGSGAAAPPDLRAQLQSEWKAAQTQEEKDRIVEKGYLKGVPMNKAAVPSLMRRNLKDVDYHQYKYTPGEVGIMNEGVQGAKDYFSPGAEMSRKFARGALSLRSGMAATDSRKAQEANDRIQSGEDIYDMATKTTRKATPEERVANSAALERISRFNGEDGSIDMGKVNDYAGQQQANVRQLDRRSRDLLGADIERMKGEREAENKSIWNLPARTKEDPLVKAESLKKRSASLRR